MMDRYALAFAPMLLACTPSFAQTPCEILGKGNVEYSAKRFDSALTIYRQVEAVDKSGKDRCTASVYATMGTIYTVLGLEAAKESKVSLDHYKKSSMYNRAFANALICNQGDCKAADEFWEKMLGWYR